MNKNEYDKQIARQMPPLDNHGLLMGEEVINQYMKKPENNGCRYLMLLCNEINYYTIFHIENTILRVKTPIAMIIDFLQNDQFLKTLGDVKYIDSNDDHIEIWIGEYYFALFVAETFVVRI